MQVKRKPLLEVLSACLLTCASVGALAQAFPKSAQPGWVHLRDNKPVLAAEAWLRAAEESTQRRTAAGLRESAYAHVLATIAYERAGDARAYVSWSDAIRQYLESGGAWEQDRESLRTRWKTLERQLAQSGATSAPSLSADEQMLMDLVKRVEILTYTGPRTGLVEPRNGSTDLSNITPQYMAGAGRPTSAEEIARPEPRYSVNHTDAPRPSGVAREPRVATGPGAVPAPAPAPVPAPPATAAGPAPSWMPRTAVAVQSAQMDTPPAAGSALALQSVRLPRQFQPRAGAARSLTPAERATALLAWRYVQVNRQSTTGLVNGKDAYPVTSVADIAMTVSAYLSALALQFVEREDFLTDMRQLLNTLSGLPLYHQELFNREYDSRTGRMLDLSARSSAIGSGWSAEDIGRLLLWLKVLAQTTPDLAPAVESVVGRLRLQRLVAAGQLHSVLHTGERELLQRDLRLGRQQVTAAALSLWGVVLPQMFGYDDVLLRKADGVQVPEDRREGGTVSPEVFARGIIEFGGLDGCFEAAARAALVAQHQLAARRGQPVMVADELLDRPPWFVQGQLTPVADAWKVTGFDQQPYPALATFSTKSAYLWSAIDTAPATQSARTLADQTEPSDHGLHGGRYLSGELNRALTLDTNASVLLALHHTLRGGVPVLRVDNPVDHRCPGLQSPTTP
jgi:Protein of unknown function (DUF3131)